MASSMAEMKKTNGGLEYLGFVRKIAINTMMCVLNLYECAKQNSGSLKSTIGFVENSVTAVLGPVYGKFKGVPDAALGFLDKKAGQVVSEFDEFAPPLVKWVVNATKQVVLKVAEISEEMGEEALAAGPRSAMLRLATLSMNFVVGHMLILLYQVSRLPVLNLVAGKVIPTATIWLGKYNNFVTKLAARGYHFFGYFPVVPIEDVTKAFKNDEVSSTLTN